MTRVRGDGSATAVPRRRRLGRATRSLDEAYEGHYRPSDGRFLGPGDWILRHTRGRLANRLDEIAPPGPVLDVGAGDGALLDALHRKGREATGLERHSNRPDVLGIDIEQAGDEWAAIVMWHSLEHLRSPAVALTHAARALRTGGILVLALPNAAALQARIFGDRWLALDLPRHLTHLPARLVLTSEPHTAERRARSRERVLYEPRSVGGDLAVCGVLRPGWG